MSDTNRELKEHARWLEDELGSLNNIEDRLDNIDGALDAVLENLDAMSKTVVGICDSLRNQCAIQQEMIDTQRQLTQAVLKLADALAPKSAPEPMASVFNEIFKETAPRRPKRQRFKPKVVTDNDPDEAAP
jgi:ABC-type transporter Mla subunit MlaD